MGRIFQPASNLLTLDNMLKAEGYQKWIFTFGCGQLNAGYCQPIYAMDYEAAREAMFDSYGGKWSFSYSEEDWEAMKHSSARRWTIDKELQPIIVMEESDDE